MTISLVDVSVKNRLEAVTLDFGRSEVTAICGPNGAGKSTLLSCLAALETPDTGKVLLGGAPLSRMHPTQRARWLGYLPQSPEIAWNVSVEVLVSLGRLPWRGAPSGENLQAIQDAISAMDLEALRHRPVSHLSGGERARALMARVLATRPGWLLADEPLANLDLAHAAAVIRRFRQQARMGRGVVLVLHDLASAMNHADRVVVMSNGKVVADGMPEIALGSDVIRRVWGLRAHWLGDSGARALSIA